MKQYLMMCNEDGMNRLKRVLNDAVEFLEVQGMATGNNLYNLLVTPIIPPIEQVKLTQPDQVNEVVAE